MGTIYINGNNLSEQPKPHTVLIQKPKKKIQHKKDNCEIYKLLFPLRNITKGIMQIFLKNF